MNPTVRQKANGTWIVDFEDIRGRRRRISTGIKSERRARPPDAVKQRLKKIVLAGYGEAMSVRELKAAAVAPEPATPQRRERRLPQPDEIRAAIQAFLSR